MNESIPTTDPLRDQPMSTEMTTQTTTPTATTVKQTKTMKPMRRALGVLALSAASVTAGWLGYEGFLNAQFARAEGQVEATRQQLKHADDMATVFRSVGKAVEPSVVNIEVHKTIKGAKRLPHDPDMLRRFLP